MNDRWISSSCLMIDYLIRKQTRQFIGDDIDLDEISLRKAFLEQFFSDNPHPMVIILSLKRSPEFMQEWLMNWLIENGYGI